MRRFTLLILFLLNTLFTTAYSDDIAQLVKVADPFLEMHTGPSAGYPIFHVIKRDENITIIKRRTSWYQIKNAREKVGWVHSSQLAKTLTLDGDNIKIKDITRDDYLEHDWEMSMIGGEFGGLSMMTLAASYSSTKNFSSELSLSQILGNFSSRTFLNINLIQQPFPDWKISPYFSIGTGFIDTKIKSTLSQVKDRTDLAANVSFGIKMYLTRRFILRTDVKKYIIFQSRNKNEEVTSWQAGFAFFF